MTKQLCPNQGEGPPPAAGEVAELMGRIRANALGDRDLIETVLALCAKIEELEAMLETGQAALLDAFQQIDGLKQRIDFHYGKLRRLEEAVPPDEGEVGGLVTALRDPCISPLLRERIRAADLLEQRHPAPVPVSERLPGPEDCDELGRCWWWAPKDPECPLTGHDSWGLYDGACDEDTHWLPHNALPLPAGEVES